MANPRQQLVGGMLGVALLDQASKWLIRDWLHPGQSVAIIPDVFQLTLAYNTGAAFSLLRQQPLLLTALTTGIFLFLLSYSLSRRHFFPGERLGLSLVLGGALGNLIDRFQQGQVTDFLDFIAIRYPVFNLADSFIFCGVVLIVVGHFRSEAAPRGGQP